MLQVVVICGKKYYTEPGLFWLELANELILCLFLYLLPAFNDARLDKCYVSWVGWVFVGIVILLALVNWTFVLWLSIARRDWARQKNVVVPPAPQPLKRAEKSLSRFPSKKPEMRLDMIPPRLTFIETKKPRSPNRVSMDTPGRFSEQNQSHYDLPSIEEVEENESHREMADYQEKT